eukprot:269376-Rhodomonas_salina.2
MALRCWCCARLAADLAASSACVASASASLHPARAAIYAARAAIYAARAAIYAARAAISGTNADTGAAWSPAHHAPPPPGACTQRSQTQDPAIAAQFVP